MSLRRLLLAPFASLALAAVGCGSPPTKVDAPYTLTLNESGGFAGVDDDTVVDSTAKTISFIHDDMPSGSGALSDSEIAQVSAAIEEANLANPAEYGGGEGVSDGFSYAFTFTTKGQSYVTTWASGEPQDIDALSSLVGDLATKHIPQAD